MTDDLRSLLIPPREKAFRTLCGLEDVPLELVVSGYEKLVILAPDRVFSFPRHQSHVAPLEREADVLQALTLDEAPRILRVHRERSVGPYPFVEMTRLPGRSWDYVDDGRLSPESVTTALESLARCIARIHAEVLPIDLAEPPAHLEAQRVTPAVTDDRWLSTTLELFPAAGIRPSPEEITVMNESLDAISRMNPTVVHGEVSDGQFLVDPTFAVTGVVDWATAHVGHPLRDLDFGTFGHRVSYQPERWGEIRRAMWKSYKAERLVPLPDWEVVELFWSLLDVRSHIEADHRDEALAAYAAIRRAS